MAGSKDRTDVSLDNILRPTVENLSAEEQQLYKDLMSQVEEDANHQLAKIQEETKEKFLAHFTVDHHQKITKHGEIGIASLVPLSQVLNVSKSDDIQSIKQYVDQQQDQVKQQIRGLKTLRELTRTFEKFVAPSFPSHETSNRISTPSTSATNGDSQS
jgi:transcription initiation factor IIF auxiliary subunit